MGRRVLICGGRSYTDRARVFRALDLAHAFTPIGAVIHGAAKGVDSFADEWAIYHGVTPERFPANWAQEGLGAGPRRNQRMLEHGRPDVVFVFHGGKGTADMLRRAMKAGVPVVRFK